MSTAIALSERLSGSIPPGRRCVNVSEHLNGLHSRLHAVVGPLSYAGLAARIGHNHETVRRYMRGGTPSVGFVAAVSIEFDCSLNWLLLGHPPRAASDIARAHLHDAV
jgi:hypothetical protein